MKTLPIFKSLLFSLLLFLTAYPSWAQQVEDIDISQSVRKLRKSAKIAGFSVVSIKQGIPLSSQMREGKCIYVVSSRIDLADRTVVVPDSCYIKFRRNGVLLGGTLQGALLNKELTVEYFGAKRDGKSDDMQAFQNAVNLSRKEVVLRPGCYYVSGLIDINHPLELKGNKSGIRFGSKKIPYPGFRIQKTKDVLLTGIRISSVNDQPTASEFSRPHGSLWSNIYAIVASQVNGLVVRDCSFQDVEYALKIDGSIGRNRSVLVEKCRTDGKVAMPMYISYTDGAKIIDCEFYATTDASYYDHHIYGCSNNRNHEITGCSFFDGVGIPVHYYTDSEHGCDIIFVKDCTFKETHGAVIVDSPDKGILTVQNVKIETSRLYDNSVFRSGGGQSLLVDGATVYAPKQRLINSLGFNTEVKNIIARVGGLVYGLPPVDGKLTVVDSDIISTEAESLLYVSESVAAKTGNVIIERNHFVIENQIEYLVSVRGNTNGEIVFDNNEVLCRKPVAYGVYNSGRPSSKLSFKSNKLNGVSSERHSTVRDGHFQHNRVVK